ncbi:MAG: hypothetical protein ACXWQO_11605 [Bdellovibrionota bacterium]
MFVRKFVSLAFLFALALPAISHADDSAANTFGGRYPASTKHHKAKKAKKGKGKKAKSGGQHHAKGKKGTHAPSHNSDAGGVNHTPPEMKEDLPAPSAESTTEH